jgi:hypothetical protein
MQINRKFLYWGTFLVAIGGVLVATNLGALDTATLTDALRLWPLAVVIIGLALVLRRNPQLSLSTGLLAAAVPGLVLGGAFAVAPRFTGDCGARTEPAITESQQGSFDGPASVSVIGGCGSIAINTAPGNAWHLDAGNTADRKASVRSSPQSLSVQSTGGDDGSSFLNGGRNHWTLTLPTSEIQDLAVVFNAGTGKVALPGARIGQLRLTANLSQISVDASAASVTNLSGAVHLGILSIDLPAGTNLVGTFRVDGGALQVCTPAGLGLRTTVTGSPREVRVADLEQKGSIYENPEYASAAHHADIDIHVAFGAVEINPIGGCK